MSKIKRVVIVMLFCVVLFITVNSSFANKIENIIKVDRSSAIDNLDNLSIDEDNLDGCNGMCAGCTLCFQSN